MTMLSIKWEPRPGEQSVWIPPPPASVSGCPPTSPHQTAQSRRSIHIPADFDYSRVPSVCQDKKAGCLREMVSGSKHSLGREVKESKF